ncbi:MAG TPA: hypothetical protein VES40_14655 [Ilumatobacteraceae bacterium]|nr:hypothetical protein [Ilumatobacteraceae bacterium]
MLIVANRTVGGDDLADEVRRRVRDGSSEFHLLVPIASPVSAAVAIGTAVGDAANMSPTASFEVSDERRIARDRLAFGLDWLTSLGASAAGELTTDCDVAAVVTRIVDASATDDASSIAEVIVSTLPTTISRWLRQDLPHRIAHRVTIPVTVITGTA